MDNRKNNNSNNRVQKDNGFKYISNVNGGISDEEFADEFLAYPASPADEEAKFQFNFLGAQLEKINCARNVRDELKQ